MSDYRFRSGPVWRFRTKQFNVELRLERIHGYRYDGDDENGETQAAIKSGELHAFESVVNVEWNDEIIGQSTLYGSVYDNPDDFYTAHRDSDPENRNTLEKRAKRQCICHYFPDMVREAIAEAREHIRGLPPLPYIRESA